MILFLPLLMNYLEITGIKIASIDSSIFSIITEHPCSIAKSKSLLILADPSLTHLSLFFFSFSLIQTFPYNYGSMINGYLSEFVKIVPFSVDTASDGNPSLFHNAIVASSVKILIGLTSGEIGILFSMKYFSKFYLIKIDL